MISRVYYCFRLSIVLYTLYYNKLSVLNIRIKMLFCENEIIT